MEAVELTLILTTFFGFGAIGVAYVLRRLGTYERYQAPLNACIALNFCAQSTSRHSVFPLLLLFVVYVLAAAALVVVVTDLARRRVSGSLGWWICTLLAALCAITAGRVALPLTQALAILTAFAFGGSVVYWFTSLPRVSASSN